MGGQNLAGRARSRPSPRPIASSQSAPQNSAGNLEALWSVEFRTFGAWVRGGVVAVEPQRLIGGDNHYYYLGTYSVVRNAIRAKVRVAHFNGPTRRRLGQSETYFEVRIVGELHGEQIVGIVYKSDAPSVQIPLRLIRQSDLP
ncbi:MAG: GrlR family regulatory protein [Pseudomonadota bacterium]